MLLCLSTSSYKYSHHFLINYYVPGLVLGDLFIWTSQQPYDRGIISPILWKNRWKFRKFTQKVTCLKPNNPGVAGAPLKPKPGNLQS